MAILSSQCQQTDWLQVDDVLFQKHVKQTPSLRASYQCGIDTFNEWICFEHAGYPRAKIVA